MEAEHVGLLTDVSASHLGLVPGKKYYVTVTACNAADLCTSVSSDGVIIDNSPPAPGVVYDGVDDMDSHFQASRTTLGAHWFGFHDPHSGLSHYEWRAGTTPGGEDLYGTTRLHLTELVHISQLDPPLPLNHTVYITVRAYNQAGLYVERTSNGFYVDESSPVMLEEPQFDLTQGSIIPDTQVWRTTLSVRWEVVDPESSIERQHLSVITHHQAGMDIEPVEIAGSIRDFRFTNLSLHDGDTYYVRLVACNGAKLCTSGQTHGVLVDSTPPTVGMLAVQTDHAAQLWRHRDGWMTYHQQNGTAPPHVRLAWLGFTDIHTGIQEYHVTIGSTFGGTDLTVDTEPPSAGIVYDGANIHDMDFQNCSSHVAASWHGFSDLQSYIHHYVWCVGSTPGTDDILTCTDVGISLAEVKEISPALPTGTKYFSTVYAVDAAGLTSSPAVSDGILVDTTPPEVLNKFNFGPNLLDNPSFENIQSSASTNLISDLGSAGNVGLTGTDNSSASNSSHVNLRNNSFTSANNGEPAHWNISGVAAVMSPSTAVSHHGVSYLLLHGSISQLIPTSPGERYRLTLHASPIFPSNTPVVAQEGYVISPGMHRVFKLYQRPSHLEGAELHVDRNITWHKHVFYFTAVEHVSEVVIGSVGPWSGITLDDVKVQEMRQGSRPPPANPNPTNQLTSPVHLETSFAHDWTSVCAAWDFVDPESPIVGYSWAIGTVRGGTQLQDFKTVGRNTHAHNEDVRLSHGSFVHVTVVAENEAALRSVVYSDPVLVDLTPPVISLVKDGSDEEDVDFQQSKTVTVHWNVTDDESGVEFCEVAIGLSPGSGEVHRFTQQATLYSATFDLTGHLTHGDTVYSTVRCHNYAGMTSHVTSNGVTIVSQPPNSDQAIVETMSAPQFYYPTRASHQSAADVIHLSWEGFFDVSGIKNYQCRVTGPGLTDFPWIDVGLTGQTHATLSGLHLHNYNRYEVHVRAVNHVGLVSDDVISEIYVEMERPLVTTGRFQSWWPRQGVMMFDWTGVFLSNSSLIYEVSIGTMAAGSDVMQWRETDKTEMRLDGMDSNKEHYVVITAVNQAGLYTTECFVLSYPGNG
ncbi:uncharacterized protein LOC118430248 [Branchiostoma floridae]|uniref:Uncharacterized protein LOC118430248 n=1 Tax=Branchiostoma floridae TaxID=7739 RepID=A0A9J7M8Q2_BRAFL|nr:uncharacterized protein LOC118430248 [Branchiostoma floridae]